MQTAFLIIALLAIGGYYTYAKIIPFIKRLKGAKNGTRIFYQDTTPLSPDQCRKLATAAIYHVYQPSYLNTLETGIEVSSIKEALDGAWGVTNHGEALETLAYLYNKGFRFYFPAVWQAYHASSEAERKSIILGAFSSHQDQSKASSQVQNLKETLPALKAQGIIQRDEEVATVSINAWDYGRMVFVSRLCYDAGYISAQEAWQFIDLADERCQAEFHDWPTLGKSYVLGRAMWGGTAQGNDVTMNIYQLLVSDPASPWLKWPFKAHRTVIS